MNPTRRSPEEVRRGIETGHSILICVYPKESFERSHLEGAISMEELNSRLPTLSRAADIVFY